jgi:hypothetical protein
MRSARMLLATATATAALAIAAPAYAVTMDDSGQEDSSHSKEYGDSSESKKPEDSSYGKEHEDSSHSKKHDDSSYGKEHDKHGKHDSPRGGMHTGGGALVLLKEDDWATAKDPKHDPETYKDKSDSSSEGHSSDKSDKEWGGGHDKEWSGEHDKGSWKDKHDKPHGGMHTGGGALASSGGVTAGGLAALAVAGAGLYTLRRKKAAGNVA